MDLDFLVPVTALLIPIIIVPTALWFKHQHRVRQMEHAERIRAMELGVVPGHSKISWPGAAVVVGIGAGVPVGTMLVAWLAVLTNDVPSEIFGIPLLISFSAIWAAKGLADRMMGVADEEEIASAKRSQTASHHAKPVVDPDAYDFVGSRG